MIEAWHFVVGPAPRLRDGRAVVVGEELRHDGPLVLCSSGLHASERAIDALQYAPGPWACRVRVRGKTVRDADKLVARKRIVLWMIDASDVLRVFARECALSVAHLWRMPAVVRRYLETGDETIRSAAQAAAWSAAQAAAWSAARGAAWSAAQDAAWSAAQDAAQDAARDGQHTVLESMLLGEAARLGYL